MKDAPKQQNISEKQHVPSKELDDAYKYLGQKEQLQKGGEHSLTLTGLLYSIMNVHQTWFSKSVFPSQVMQLMTVKPLSSDRFFAWIRL